MHPFQGCGVACRELFCSFLFFFARARAKIFSAFGLMYILTKGNNERGEPKKGGFFFRTDLCHLFFFLVWFDNLIIINLD